MLVFAEYQWAVGTTTSGRNHWDGHLWTGQRWVWTSLLVDA